MKTWKQLSWITWTLMTVAGVVVVFGVLVPNYVRVTARPVWNVCTYNLQRIQKAKQAWANETGTDGGAVPSLSDITPYLRRHAFRTTTMQCPAGARIATNFASCYAINAVTNLPTCKILPRQHVLQ